MAAIGRAKWASRLARLAVRNPDAQHGRKHYPAPNPDGVEDDVVDVIGAHGNTNGGNVNPVVDVR